MTVTAPAPDLPSLKARAHLLRELHGGAEPVLFANVWDVASAVVVESAGARAIATTSAGVAWSLGVPDGNLLGRARAVELVARVAHAVAVPVTADIEGGFAEDAAGVGDTVRAVLTSGAVGINIEDVAVGRGDALRPTSEQVERIAAARASADAAGVGPFVNARVDTYLRDIGDSVSRLDDTLARATAYLAAGADGIFVPGVVDLETVRRLAAAIPAPLNILVGPGAPSVAELAAVGVRRISLGSSVAAAAYAVAERAAHELVTTGTYDSVSAELDYGRLNRLVG